MHLSRKQIVNFKQCVIQYIIKHIKYICVSKGPGDEDTNSSDSSDGAPILGVNNNYYKAHCDKEAAATASAASNKDNTKHPNPSHSKGAKVIIDLLSEYCHSKILNVDYLLGHSSQPFTTENINKKVAKKQQPQLKISENISGCSEESPASSSTMSKAPKLKLKSGKMMGLKDLLFAEKLNANAIQLQLTALSHNNTVPDQDQTYNSRPKRSRRE